MLPRALDVHPRGGDIVRAAVQYAQCIACDDSIALLVSDAHSLRAVMQSVLIKSRTPGVLTYRTHAFVLVTRYVSGAPPSEQPEVLPLGVLLDGGARAHTVQLCSLLCKGRGAAMRSSYSVQQLVETLRTGDGRPPEGDPPALPRELFARVDMLYTGLMPKLLLGPPECAGSSSTHAPEHWTVAGRRRPEHVFDDVFAEFRSDVRAAVCASRLRGGASGKARGSDVIRSIIAQLYDRHADRRDALARFVERTCDACVVPAPAPAPAT